MVNCYPEGVGFNASGMAGGVAGGGAHFRMYGEDGRLLQDYGSGSVDMLAATDQIVEVRVSGGAGYGSPFERPVEHVLSDLNSGYISREQAIAVYGVAFTDDGAINMEATRRVRDDGSDVRAHVVQQK